MQERFNKKTRDRTVLTTMYISRPLYDDLQAAAKEMGETLADITRRALKDWLTYGHVRQLAYLKARRDDYVYHCKDFNWIHVEYMEHRVKVPIAEHYFNPESLTDEQWADVIIRRSIAARDMLEKKLRRQGRYA